MSPPGVNGGFAAHGGGFLSPQVRGGGSGSSLPAVTIRPFRDVVNVKSADYGAVGDGVTNDLPAFQLALADSKLLGFPMYVPQGTYRLEFTGATGTTAGSLIIDFEDFEIFGDGLGKSIIHGSYPATTSSGRRLSHVSNTTPIGAVGTISAIGASSFTMTTAADALLFRSGDSVYFSPSITGTPRREADSSVPEDVGDAGNAVLNLVSTRNGTTGVVVASNISYLSGAVDTPVPGDYVFVQNKVFLVGGPGGTEYLSFPVGSGFVASPNSNGSSPRSTTTGFNAKIVSVDSTNNAFTYALFDGEITAFADNDYLFIRPNFGIFFTDFGTATLASGAAENRNRTFRDLTVQGENYGIDTTDYTSWIQTNLIIDSPSVAGASAPYTLTIERCRLQDAHALVYLASGVGSAAPNGTYRLHQSEFSGGVLSVVLYTDPTANRTCELVADYCTFEDTTYSHHLYVHTNVGLTIDHNRFLASGVTPGGGHGEAIDHWGNYKASFACITNNFFGAGISARAYMTSTTGDFYFAGNTVECRLGVAVRCGGTIVGNTFRARGNTSTVNYILPYTYYSEAMTVGIIGNTFDVGVSDPAYGIVCVDVETPGRWLIQGNRLISSYDAGPNYNATGGPYPWAGSVTFVEVNASAVNDYLGTITLANVDILDNDIYLGTTAAALMVALYRLPNVRIEGNTYKGAVSASYGAIATLSTPSGDGLVRIRDNRIDVTTGDGIRITGAPTGSPRFVVTDNDITQRTSTRICTNIDVSLGTGEMEYSRNTHTGGVYSLRPTSSVAADKIRGEGNTFNSPVFAGNRQRLLPKAGTCPTTVAQVGELMNLTPHFGRFLVSAAGATTVNGILLGGTLASQLMFDTEVTLEFVDGNVTLGAGGALAAWAGTTAYVVGDVRTNSSNIYQCISITTGISAGSGGPTTTAASITDGGVTWKYIGAGTSLGNLTATGGARGAGTFCRLLWSVTAGKWVEQ